MNTLAKLGFAAVVLLVQASCTTIPVPRTHEPCATPGCAVGIVTNPRQPRGSDLCFPMLIAGILVPDAIYGLGLQQSDGTVRGVMWPFRWSARREADGIVLINRAGEIVAREGLNVSLTGGHARDYDFICDPELEGQ